MTGPCAPLLALLAAVCGPGGTEPADPTLPTATAVTEQHAQPWADVLDVPAPYADWGAWLAATEPAGTALSDRYAPEVELDRLTAEQAAIEAQAAAERAEREAAERAQVRAEQHLSDDAGDEPDTAPYYVVSEEGASSQAAHLEDSEPTHSASVDWDALARCESGYGGEPNWDLNTGNGYYGGLQFSAESWAWVGGSGLPHEHSRDEQIARAEVLLDRQGLGAWPACTRKLGWR